MSIVHHAGPDGVHRVVLHRPEKLNALTADMFVELPRLLSEISRDREAVAVVLTGAGRAFCAGADLGFVADLGRDAQELLLPPAVGNEADLLATCEVPVIAVVDGVAAGAGMWLACAADFRVFEPGGYLLEAHAKRGLTPTAMSWLLPRLIGHARATDIVLRGRPVEAQEAFDLGLATELVAAGEGEAAAARIAEELRAIPIATVRATKAALRMSAEGAGLAHLRSTGGYLNRCATAPAQTVGPPET